MPDISIKVAALLAILVLTFESCKKKDKHQDCTHCSCIDYNKVVAYQDTLIDSAAFFQTIIGKWYVKEFDTFGNYSCTNKCLCDTSFPVTIIDGKTLSIAFPGNPKDTFSYTFRINGNKVVPYSGVFDVPGILSPVQEVWLEYNNGYLLLYTQTSSPGTRTFPPNYILTH